MPSRNVASRFTLSPGAAHRLIICHVLCASVCAVVGGLQAGLTRIAFMELYYVDLLR